MTRYEPAIDVDALTAIDMHVHVEVDAHGHSSLPPELAEAASRYFSTDGPRPDLDSIAAYYRERRMAAVVFTVDAQTNLGQAPLSSAEIAEGAARHNDVLIPFGSVDPLQGAAAVDAAARLIEHAMSVIAEDAVALLAGDEAHLLAQCEADPCSRFLLKTHGRMHWC